VILTISVVPKAIGVFLAKPMEKVCGIIRIYKDICYISLNLS